MRLLNRRSASEPIEGTSVLPRAVERRQRPFWRRPWVLIATAAVAVAFLFLSVVLSDRDANVAEERTDRTAEALGEVADPLAELCRTDPAIRARVGDAACGLAQRAVDNPAIPTPGPAGVDGLPGDRGAEGRGIVSTTLSGGDLVVNYSDGTRDNVGTVTGPAGDPGDPGANGDPGVGITGSSIADGRLILTFSDGTSRDVGQVVGQPGSDGAPGVDGASGDAGANGQDGRGVASVDQVDGRLVITYDDGSTEDAGPLPPGPAGPAGADGNPATTLVLEGAGPLGGDLTCARSNEDPTAPVYTCS